MASQVPRDPTITPEMRRFLDDLARGKSSADATAQLDVFTDLLQGVAPASGGGTVNFLRADATWQPVSTVAAASQAEQEAATSTTVYTSPGTQQFHPGPAKWWLKAIVSAGVPALSASHNVTSITDTATGRLTVTIATDFSGTEWVALNNVQTSSATIRLPFVNGASAAAGSIEFGCVSSVPALADPDCWECAGYGDQ